jgi:hypothetical protein
VRGDDHGVELVDLEELARLVSAVPVMPASFLYMRKKFCSVIVARVWVSPSIRTFSLASMAWCSPSDQRRPAIRRPVNSSTIRILPSWMTYSLSFS